MRSTPLDESWVYSSFTSHDGKTFDCDGDYRIKNLTKEFPVTLTSIILNGWYSLKTIETSLPSGLEKLAIYCCYDLTTLPDSLPEGLTDLDIRYCEKLTTLPILPSGLKKLSICQCKSLEALKLSKLLLTGLEKLTLSKWKDLGPLPDSLIELSFFHCLENHTTLLNLPVVLEKLSFIRCYNIETLPPLLIRLKWLYLSNCDNLTTLPDPLPEGLTDLDLRYCEKLTTLPNSLPKNLVKLNLCGCKSLTTLPDPLPEGLTELDLSYCEKLTTLPKKFPASLKRINLYGCSGLQNNTETIELLQRIEEQHIDDYDFKLIWPSHLNPQIKIKNNLEEAYRKFYEGTGFLDNKTTEPNNSFPLYFLIHRFTNEHLAQRKGKEKIIREAHKVSEIINNNPDLLEHLDESSRSFTDACVNQPVAGFTEIATICEVYNQQTIIEKLEKAKMLMVIEKIKEEVTKLNSSIRNVQVELGNAMYREVFKFLKNNDSSSYKIIKEGEEWSGVPEGVAYQSSIQNLLTPENIQTVSKSVKEFLERITLEQVKDSMISGSYAKFWSSMVLDKEERKSIMKEYTDAVIEGTLSREELERMKIDSETKIMTLTKEKIESAIREHSQQPPTVLSPLPTQETVSLRRSNSNKCCVIS